MEHGDNCREFLTSLSDYVDGVLQEELCAEIERHMSDCEDCRIVIDTLRKTVFLYRTTPMPPTVPDDVRQRLFHRLDLDDFLNR
jgi:predicted anti-sigma-YlaC factor YlaD